MRTLPSSCLKADVHVVSTIAPDSVGYVQTTRVVLTVAVVAGTTAEEAVGSVYAHSLLGTGEKIAKSGLVRSCVHLSLLTSEVSRHARHHFR